MSFRPKGIYRTRMPKISTGKKIEWEPLLEIKGDEEEHEKPKQQKRNKKIRSEMRSKSNSKGDKR